jgi:hypothetical protein
MLLLLSFNIIGSFTLVRQLPCVYSQIKKRNRQAVRREVARVLKEVRGASAWKSLSNHAAPHQPLDNRLPRADDVLQSVLDAAPVDGLHLDSIIWEQIDKNMADFKWAEEDDYEDLIDTLTQSEQLRKELADWSISHNISKKSLTPLLKILQRYGLDVPLHADTLVQTPKSIVLEQKSGGDYYYFGLKNCIQTTLMQCEASLHVSSINLRINIDGLPTFKSKNMTMWPVQCNFADYPDVPPFIVAVYSGKHKPNDLEFLVEFILELKHLMELGIEFQGTHFPIRVHSVICDAPAKALIKGILQYNGKYGCDYCEVKGEHCHGRMLFLSEGRQRDDERFRAKTNQKHHKVDSPFLELDIDMISTFPIDPMHALDLGVMKKLLLLWKEGPLSVRQSHGHMSILSNRLLSVRHYVPPEFNRKPRQINEVKMWKATEFRLFLLYLGPVVLLNVLPENLYAHFMTLNVASRIMLSSNLAVNSELLSFAHMLMCYFVSEGQNLYSKNFVTYGVHILIHLAHFAEKYSGLSSISAYVFENNMSTIKRGIRGTGNPLRQVIGRNIERNRLVKVVKESQLSPKKSYCYLLKSGKYCIVNSVSEDTYICHVFMQMNSFYQKPCDSRCVDVFLVRHSNFEVQHCSLKDFECCAICIPLSLIDSARLSESVIMRLLH